MRKVKNACASIEYKNILFEKINNVCKLAAYKIVVPGVFYFPVVSRFVRSVKLSSRRTTDTLNRG